MAEEQSLYNEASEEISISVKIVKAVRGNLSGSNVSGRHIEDQDLDETWSRVKEEISELEEDLRSGDRKAAERIENFLAEDSHNLEDIVAYLIGSYLLAKDAMQKIHNANEQAPPYMQENFNVQRQKERVEDISRAVYQMLGQIDSGVEKAYRELEEVEQETGDRDIENLLRFFEEMHNSINDFRENGEIDRSIRSEIKAFVEEEKQEIEKKQQRQRDRGNQHFRNQDRRRF